MLSDQQATTIVQTAIAAPSVHNTQPWLFEVLDDDVLVLADPARALPRQDPDGRELLLSCGAATLHAELAARGLGLRVRTTLLPQPDRPALVARLRTAPGGAADAEVLRLLDAVPRRHTDRSPFADQPVPTDLLRRLVRAAEQEGAWLEVLTTADVLELALLQTHAQADLAADAAALRERAVWARSAPEPADGLPADLLPGCAPGAAASRAVRSRPASVTDVVLVLGTQVDDRASWVRAGKALARLLLEGTAAGLVAAPATLALEMPALRGALTAALALQGAPQMVLRTGFPAGPGTARSGRRDVADVLLPAGR